MFGLLIISKEKSDKDQISIKNQHAINIIFQMEESIRSLNQDSFKNLLETYISQFGQAYEKEEVLLTGYAKVYYIRSQDNHDTPITPQETNQLINILNQATLKPSWNNSLSINLPVINIKTLKTRKKLFTLSEIINAIEKANSPIKKYFDTAQMATIGILGILAISTGLYYTIEDKQRAMENVSYAWQDFKTSLYQVKKYFTEPQNYQQFEKEHDLNSENMTQAERQQRFRDWQIGKKIQQDIDKQMIQLQRFEKRMRLPSDNMLIEDRIAIFKEWQKQERAINLVNQKMKPVELFEKKHSLNSENMTKEERQKRFKEWQTGNNQEKNLQERMKPVKKFEKQHDLLSENMDEKQRIQRYREWKKGYEHQQYIDKKMIEVITFEKKMQLPSDNMHYEDRIKIFDTWQQEQAREKMIMAMILWEETNKDNYWLMEKDRTYDYHTNSWITRETELNEDERIARYQRNTNPLERIFLENQNTMKAVEAFEKKMNLSTENMYYQDRVKIFSQWQEEQAREKSIKGMSAWEQKFNIPIISNHPIFIEMSKEDRINRYHDYYSKKFWSNPSMKDIENFEAKFELNSMKKTNEYEIMTDDERLTRYQYFTTQNQRFLWENFGNDFNIF